MESGFSFMAYFELILTLLVIFSGLLYLADVVYFAKKRAAAHVTTMPKFIEYARSFFPILLFVLLIRSFCCEPFRIPSGSLHPTLLEGDFILVNKFTYGLRLPVLHDKFLSMTEPKRGDIVVFRSPTTPDKDLVKRIVAIPGDRISYINKTLYINGVVAPQTLIGPAQDIDENGNVLPVTEKSERLDGVMHHIYQRLDMDESGDFQNILVPKDSYFAMGDNRDNSADSRFWGFMPEQNIIGKASYIMFSWNADTHRLRLDRFFRKIV